MSADANAQDMEPVELTLDEAAENTQGPVPVPPPVPKQQPSQPTPTPSPADANGLEQSAEEQQEHEPVPVPPPDPKPKPVDTTPIQLVEADTQKTSKRKAFGSAARAGFEHKTDFQRDLNLTGQGATRCRVFHSRLSDAPLAHMESVINEWLDENEIEVKFVTQTIGTMEGKRTEENLLVVVWY
jgi:hypothetical protein